MRSMHDDEHGHDGHHQGRRGPWAARFGGAREHHQHGGGRGRGGAGAPFGPGGFGPGRFGPGFAPGFGFGREGRRARRGDVRLAVLGLLADGAENGEPYNGYGLIRAIAERTGGNWRPSPGSVYPTLQQLVDEGLVRAVGTDGRSTYELTDAGRAEVEARTADIARAWETSPSGVSDTQRAFAEGLQKLFGVVHFYRSGASEAQLAAARDKIDQLRRELLQILAE
ncbi:PadR family transcriptional regulator [Curtobacterium sp. MCBD17_019]|nr:PadR family transcriptional regulator [Curtobacterium sp. MCBD17_019]